MTHIDIIKVRNMMRTIAAASAVVLSMGAGSVFAQIDVSGTNGTTGANSVNENMYDVDADVDVDIDNTADTTNVAVADVDAGANDISMNTTVEDITTGDVIGEVSFDTELNSGGSLSLDSLMMQDVSVDSSNDTTGANSENTNDVDVDSDVDIDITNTADVSNVLSATVRTGGNAVRQNTTVGDVTTGDTIISGDFTTEVNSNTGVDLGNMSAPSVDASFSNDTTGFSSSNVNTVDVDSDLDVDVTNDATVNNTATVSATPGNNAVTGNTTVGNIHTGGVRFEVNSTTTANSQ
ncbi:MAG TPA: hypothetical protein VGE59_01700 [Patescibacteria group bacterium]